MTEKEYNYINKLVNEVSTVHKQDYNELLNLIKAQRQEINELKRKGGRGVSEQTLYIIVYVVAIALLTILAYTVTIKH